MLEIGNHDHCTGCGLCQFVCKKNAIEMKIDSEGFSFPFINNKRCINCDLCRIKCPMNTSIEENECTEYFAAWHKDDEILQNSSSGGVFTALAEYVISLNGIVWGVCQNSNTKELSHYSVEKASDLNKLRLSKYYQAEPIVVYEQIKKQISDKRYVLFVGTACQVDSVKNYLVADSNKEYLLTADILCHGVPSRSVFEKYLSEIEKKYHKKIIDYRFRYKNDDLGGWKNGNSSRMVIWFEDGKQLITDSNMDVYFKAFNGNLILRESCYSCKYCGNKRVSDFTLADYWGVTEKIADREQQNKGVSFVIVSTSKGKKIWDDLNSLVKIPTQYELAASNNLALKNANNRPEFRSEAINQINQYGFTKTIKKHYSKYYRNNYIKKLIGYSKIVALKNKFFK